MRIAFTQAKIDRLPPPPAGKASLTFWDTNLPGFGIRVSKFRKTWISAYTVTGGRPVMESLATTNVVPKLDAARELARASILRAHAGTNPVEERRQEAAPVKAEAFANAMTFHTIANAYIERHAEPNNKPATLREVRRQLEKAATYFGDRALRDLGEADVAALIAVRTRKAWRSKKQGRAEANNCLVIVRRCLRWAKRTVNPETRKHYVEVDFSADIEKPLTKDRGRDRVLTDHEIAQMWRGCSAVGHPFGPLIKLLLLTGQRRSEVGGMRWDELDIERRVWHLPGSRTKNGGPNDVHLSDLALAVIRSIPRQAPLPNKPDFVFTTTRCGPVTGFAVVKARHLDKWLGATDWVLHDLRRTMASNMARLGVRIEVADKVLNHVSGKLGGIVGIYQKWEFLPERKAALDTWAAFVADLTRLRRPEHEQQLPLAAE